MNECEKNGKKRSINELIEREREREAEEEREINGGNKKNEEKKNGTD